MITSENRAYAIKQARLRHLNHIKNGRGCEINHIAKNIGCEEATRRGLLGEAAFVHEFRAAAIDGAIHDRGDGGRDFWLPFQTPKGVRRYKVDVKTKSVQKNWPALMRSGTHLRVPVSLCAPDTIYIFGIYLEPSDNAEVLAWEWGRTLIAYDERGNFENGNGEECLVRKFEKLRDLQSLKDRLVVRADLFA